MSYAVIYNPVSSQDPVDAVRSGLEDSGIDATWIETTEEDPGVGQARRAAEQGCRVAIVVGGDGTVRAAAEGLVDTGTALAIVPAGTGNLLARNLDIPTEPSEALAIAVDGNLRQLDVGLVNGEVFTVIAGAGVDAVIMGETSRESKDRLGVLAYVLEGAKHIFDDPIEAAISVDEGEALFGQWATIMVGNLGQLQGGVDLLPDSEPDDGLLDLLGLSADSPLESLAAAFSLVGGDGDRLVRAQAGHGVIEFGRATPYQLDGEARSAVSRLEFRADPGALRVCVPRRTS